jgi:cell division septation protein DedD
MAKTDGEYELVLGNRQLLSAFFIVVILFALFFTMGYIVGRNSAPSTMASLPQAAQSAASVRPSPASSAPPSATLPRTEPASESPAPAEPAAVEEKSPEPATRPVAAPERTASRETPVSEPRPGQTFLQVAAVAQPQAGAVVETLKQKGFPARLGPGPNNTIFRVLVGPYADAATLGKAKADLENAGFHPIMRK